MRRKYARQAALFPDRVKLVLAGSVASLSYAGWVRDISRGNEALAKRDLTTAAKAYDAAAGRRFSFPFANNLASGVDRQLLFNRIRVLYAANRPDELARLLEAEAAREPAIAEDGEYQFWSGNLQFQKAIAQREKQQLQNGLQQASESYRRALAAEPDDWDFKYNYELTVRLLDGLRKGKEENVEKLKRGQMKILREDNETGKEKQRQVAPAKRG